MINQLFNVKRFKRNFQRRVQVKAQLLNATAIQNGWACASLIERVAIKFVSINLAKE